MKRLLLLLPLLFSGSAAIGQELGGRIYNALTGNGVEDAQVINARDSVLAVSGIRGTFHISSVPFPAVLRISKPGFELQELRVTGKDRILQIPLVPSALDLSEVLVKSTLFPGRLRQVPGSVNLLTREDFKRGDQTQLLDAVSFVPGVMVGQGALNTNKISIRGIGSRSQYSTNRIQAYLDGIPLTSGEGILTLDDLDPETLERIEVIKGPASSIYGAGLGGALNLFTALPEEPQTSVRLKAQVGSFHTRKQVLVAEHADETSALVASLNRLQSDGYRSNGSYDRSSGLVRARLRGSKTTQLSFLANFTRLKAFIPSSLNQEDFREDPGSAAYTWEQARGYESYDRGLLGVSYEQGMGKHFSNTTSLFLRFRDAYEPRPFDILDEDELATGIRTRFHLNTRILHLPGQVSFGGEYFREWYEMATYENRYQEQPEGGSLLGRRLSGNTQDREYANLFAQLQLNLLPALQLEAGVNFNTTRYGLKDLYVEDDLDQTGQYDFAPVLSPRIGVSYEVLEEKNLYASVSHGFSIPTVAETLTPEGQINTVLKPATGVNYEVGFKGSWLENTLYTQLSLFSTQVRNLLVAQRVAEDRYVGRNAGKTDHSGLEFLARYRYQVRPRLSLRPYLNVTFNVFRFDEFVDGGEDFSGKRLPGVPDTSLSLGMDLVSQDGWEFYGRFRAVGRLPLNDPNSVYSEAYQLLDLKASYRWDLGEAFDLQLFAGINNTLDAHYAASVLPNAVGFGGAAPRYFYPGHPRNYFAGFRLDYQFR